MSSDSPITPRKRAKLDSFATSLSQLLAHLQALSHSLASLSTPTPSVLLQELRALADKREAVESSLRKIGKQRGEIEQREWRDKLDRAGTELWNRSTALRENGAAGGEVGAAAAEWLRVVAQMRLNAFKIILLGSLEPLSAKDRVALLSLSTKTFIALCASDDTHSAEAVLSLGADFCAEVPIPSTVDPHSPSSAAAIKAVIAHYTARVSSSVQSGNNGVAEWIKGKIKEDLLRHLSEREITRLSCTAYDSGIYLLSRRSAGEGEEDDRSSLAAPWLLWSLELLEGNKGEAARGMKINALSALAQAYLDASPAQSGWEKAEAAITQLLHLEPSAATSRRRIKLIIARGGGDGEVRQAFIDTAKATPWTEDDGSRLLHELHKLPDNRRALRTAICEALVDAGIATHQGDPPSAYGEVASSKMLGQILLYSFLFVKDTTWLCAIVERVTRAAPSYQLEPEWAFGITTYLWRAADKAHAQGDLETASKLYIVCTQPMMLATKELTWPKSFRKAALCYGDLREYPRAEATIRQAIAIDSGAKSYFIQFFHLTAQHLSQQAANTLDAMVGAKGFSVQLLLWSAKVAQDASDKTVLAKVLETLLGFCKKAPGTTDVDLMALLRALIRLSIDHIGKDESAVAEMLPRLRTYFSSALELATGFSQLSDVPDSLSKNVGWLHKIAFNLSARFAAHPALELGAFSETIVSLIELESTLVPAQDPETLSILCQCRLAALSERLMYARGATGDEQVKAYKNLFPQLEKLKTESLKLKRTHSQLKRVDSVLSVVGAFEIEALVVFGDWGAALALISGNDLGARSVKSMKALAQRVLQDDACPIETVRAVLQGTLKALFGIGEIDRSALAPWVRLMVGLLIDDRPDEALSYIESAADFIAKMKQSYPLEEQAWLTFSAWDKGIDYFDGHDSTAGRRWCLLGIRLARASQSASLAKMEIDYEALCERYPEDEGGLVMREG